MWQNTQVKWKLLSFGYLVENTYEDTAINLGRAD